MSWPQDLRKQITLETSPSFKWVLMRCKVRDFPEQGRLWEELQERGRQTPRAGVGQRARLGKPF